MVNNSKHKIQKLEAAQKQLQTAIKLWFSGGDQISIHTLACAAYQILHDINIHSGSMKWYRYSGHLEKCVIGMKLLEAQNDNKEKELFETILN